LQIGTNERKGDYGAFPLLDLKQESKIDTKTKSQFDILFDTTQDTGQKTKLQYGLKEQFKFKGTSDIMKPSQRQDFKEGLKMRDKIKVKTKTVRETVDVLIPKTPKPRVPRTPRPTITPRTIVPKIIPKVGNSVKMKRRPISKLTKREEFLALTKRYGKEVVIAKGTDVRRVVAIGKKRVSETLGATLKLTTARGKQLKLNPTKGFRTGKQDPLAIVQRRGARLSAMGERREIKQARRGILSVA